MQKISNLKDNNDVTVVLMAGGQSRRFGSNKALTLWEDKPLIEHILKKIEGVTSKVVLSVAKSGDYEWLKVEKIADIIPGIGPMGGLLSCFEKLQSQYLMLVACDMPLLNQTLLKFMLHYKCKEPILIPKAGKRMHPLHARYNKDLLPILKRLISEKRYKMAELFKEVPIKTITQKDVPSINLELCLSNINTPHDFETIRKSVNKNPDE